MSRPVRGVRLASASLGIADPRGVNPDVDTRLLPELVRNTRSQHRALPHAARPVENGEPRCDQVRWRSRSRPRDRKRAGRPLGVVERHQALVGAERRPHARSHGGLADLQPDIVREEVDVLARAAARAGRRRAAARTRARAARRRPHGPGSIRERPSSQRRLSTIRRFQSRIVYSRKSRWLRRSLAASPTGTTFGSSLPAK